MKGMVKIILFSKICVKDSKWKREAGLWLKKTLTFWTKKKNLPVPISYNFN